jgi:hypothetical protein
MGIETRVPMGLTIIGGTLVSTVLTLFVVPALYLMLVRFERESPKLEDALQGSSPDSSYQAYRTRYEH